MPRQNGSACSRQAWDFPLGEKCPLRGTPLSSKGDTGSRGAGRKVAALVAWTLVASCGSQAPNPPESDEALTAILKTRIERAYDFTAPNVLERMTSLYPDSGRVISASGGQLITTGDSLRAGITAFWNNVGRNMRDAKWTWGDVYVNRLSDDSAVLTATWSIPHIAPTNTPHTIRGAWTAVFRRIGSEWFIVTEHLSSPPS